MNPIRAIASIYQAGPYPIAFDPIHLKSTQVVWSLELDMPLRGLELEVSTVFSSILRTCHIEPFQYSHEISTSAIRCISICISLYSEGNGDLGALFGEGLCAREVKCVVEPGLSAKWIELLAQVKRQRSCKNQYPDLLCSQKIRPSGRIFLIMTGFELRVTASVLHSIHKLEVSGYGSLLNNRIRHQSD